MRLISCSYKIFDKFFKYIIEAFFFKGKKQNTLVESIQACKNGFLMSYF